MGFFPGTGIFAGQKDIYYVMSIVLFIMGIGFIISAFLSSWSTNSFYMLIVAAIIIIVLAITSLIATYKLGSKEK